TSRGRHSSEPRCALPYYDVSIIGPFSHLTAAARSPSTWVGTVAALHVVQGSACGGTFTAQGIAQRGSRDGHRQLPLQLAVVSVRGRPHRDRLRIGVRPRT